MSIIEIKDNIYIIKNIFTPEKCNEIIRFIKNNTHLLQFIDVNKEKKNNVECSFILINDNKENKYLSLLNDFIKCKITDIIKLLLKINVSFPTNIYDNGYIIRQIYGETVLHIDSIFDDNITGTEHPRLLSIIINLNDDYDGGEFYFPKQQVRVNLKAGEIICFPPYWTHPHEVSSVFFGQYRYTINTWLLQ